MTKFIKFNYENYRIMMNLFSKWPRKELFRTTICSASSSLSRLARFPRLVFCAGVFVVGGLDVEAWTLSSLNLPKPEPGGVWPQQAPTCSRKINKPKTEPITKSPFLHRPSHNWNFISLELCCQNFDLAKLVTLLIKNLSKVDFCLLIRNP